MSASKPVLLILHVVSDAHRDQLAQHFEVLYAPDSTLCAQALAAHGSRIQVVLTIGAIGLSAAQMQAMPQLRMVGALGAGYENIDVAYAKAHGIAVSNGAGNHGRRTMLPYIDSAKWEALAAYVNAGRSWSEDNVARGNILTKDEYRALTKALLECHYLAPRQGAARGYAWTAEGLAFLRHRLWRHV